ncbi:hypothetical protein FHX74_001217 [Friedmanniella endophytica]|uniref:PH domain-containing protein n=1 Tax=Microlunatus kandeliicorticis TaxID=1759536 RepID=A0A7W3IQY5_9ACTN|nr:hypothetical protein [Microlunatus kandeliicorticis]MBA8793612.1 hypothetical protein [Microlunatus kandeliicorticis]
MAEPLTLAYNWRTPAVVSTSGLVLCLGLLIHARADGWLGVCAVIVLFWAAFMVVVWLRTRARMAVDGAVLTVRHYRGTHRLDGRKVVAVREYVTGSGPSYKVRLSGDPKVYFVPTALIRRGHSSFFDWVLRYAPDAELDRRSRRTIDLLRTRGLLE